MPEVIPERFSNSTNGPRGLPMIERQERIREGKLRRVQSVLGVSASGRSEVSLMRVPHGP